jgi:hypothetical protein
MAVLAQEVVGGSELSKMLVEGLSLGTIYALLAVGFVIIFKATQVLNFAHGALAALGAFLVAGFATVWDIPGRWIPNAPAWVGWMGSVLLALIAMALIGMALERVFLRPMVGEELFAVAIVTLGIDIVIRSITNDFISSGQYDQIQGIWASGMGKQILDAIKAANKKFVPIADADVGGFVTQQLDPVGFPDLKGAAVTNTAAVGGAGITLALKLLNGETVTTATGATQPNTVLLDPVVVDNLTDAGKAELKAWQSVPGMDPLWPLSLSIEGWTTYDPNTVPADCKGA